MKSLLSALVVSIAALATTQAQGQTSFEKLKVSSSASGENVQTEVYNPVNGIGQVAGIRLHTASGWNVMLRTVQNVAWMELTDANGNWFHRWNAHDYYAKGKIKASEVKVETPVAFPDYVFAPSYRLRPLAEVASYIKANQHLPGIPSAQEVSQNGGIDLGAMNVKLLEKVEELTLYLLEQNEQIDQLKKEIEVLKQR